MHIVLDYPLAFCVAIFVLLMLSLECGRVLARRRPLASSGQGAAIEGAIFAILGLLIAFTISGAATRFDHRRDLIVEEANALGTAALRIDIAPAAAQPPLRDALRRYVDARLGAYDAIADAAAFRAGFDRAAVIQKEIWTLAIAAGRRPDALPAVNQLLLPALNAVFDIATTRALATQMHPPGAIYAMLLVLAFAGSVLAGLNMAATPRRDWLHLISYALTMTVTIYVIIDIEYPRAGLIDVTGFEKTALALAGRH